MFGFFSSILSTIEGFRKNKLERTKKRLQSLKNKINNQRDSISNEVIEDEQIKQVNKKLTKSKIRLFILSVISFIIVILEILMALILSVYTLLLLFIGIIVVLFLLLMTSLLEDEFDYSQIPQFKPPQIEERQKSQGNRGKLNWTLSELATRGTLLTDAEKNLYRLIFLSKEAVEGYDGSKRISKYGEDVEFAAKMVAGLSSTETGMDFYVGGAQYNIMEVPSNIPPNKKGYGFLGLSVTKTVEDYYGATASIIKNKYKPITTPSADPTYAPWGVAMSTQHLYNSMRSYVNIKSTEEKMDRMLDVFGIKANRQEVKQHLAWFLAQAHYHGAYLNEHEEYIAFYCALYAATAENDEDRSFSKWVLVSPDYSESTVRYIVLGTSNHKSMSMHNTPATLKLPKTSAYFELNGKRIDKPLWTFIYEKFGHMPEIQKSWQLVKDLAIKSGNSPDRILNFHYGFNSLLQAESIVRTLQDKMGVSAGFEETPGQGQGNWGGKTVQEVIDSYSNVESYRLKLAKSFAPHWGTAKYIEPQVIAGVNWEPDKWGVPFYRQGGGQESYSLIPWRLRSSSTFDYSACMIYAFAYTASALTGDLINPAEMGSVMWVTGALLDPGAHSGGAGLVWGKASEPLRMLGLKVDEVTPRGANTWTQVDKTLENNGLAIVYATGGVWTSATHFFVITDKKVEGGKNLYKVYTSTRVDQTMAWWGREAFNTLSSRIYLVTK